MNDNARNELGIGKLRLRHRGALLLAAGLQQRLTSDQAGGGEPPVFVPEAPVEVPVSGAAPPRGAR